MSWRIVLALGLLAAWLLPEAAHAAGKRVLIIYSYEDALPWQTLVRRGLFDAVAKIPEADRPVLFEERVDGRRLDLTAVSAALPQYIAEKYKGIRFDAVITESYLAAEFLRSRPALFPGAARYYVNPGKSDWRAADGIAIGVGDNIGPSVAIIPRMMPRLRRLVVVGDQSPTVRQRVEDVRPIIAALPDITGEIWDDLTLAELWDRAARLEPDSAIFLIGVFRDRAGTEIRPVEVAERLARVSPAPVFVHYDSLLNTGVVGGYVLSAERLGALIGDVVSGRIADPGLIAALGQQAYSYLFDHGPLQHKGLKAAALPEGAVLLNRPTDLWQAYRWQIVTVSIALAVQFALIVALLLALRSRGRALAELGVEQRRVARHSEELRAANRDLQQRNHELEVFATVSSHDLREPLRTVSSYVTLLERRYGNTLDEDGRTFIAFARDAAQRANQLVLDLLEYARTGHSDSPPEHISAAAVAAQVVNALGQLVAETGAKVEIATDLPALHMVRDDLHRLLQNLIDNGLKHHHPDRPPVISVTASRRGGAGPVFSVTDNGQGIEPAYFSKIFELFQRLTPRTSPQGTGIGLSVCRKIVDKYGGEIWVESQVEKGSSFQFTLPFATPP